MYRRHKNEYLSPFVKKLFGGTALAAILCGTSFFILQDYREQKAYQTWAREKNQELYNSALPKRSEERLAKKESQKKNDSFYQRLHDRLPVRILVLGDAYGQGLGAGKKASTWFSILENSLRKKYKVNVTMDNMSLSKESSAYSGFALLNTLKNQSQGGKDYDLCILSFGTNDTPKDFSLWYEGILRNLRDKYPHCSVMSILGHQGVMQPEFGYLDDNADALASLTKAYHGTLIDMPEAMLPKNHEKSEEIKSQYTNDGLFLNDEGQQLLADTIFHSIVSTAAKYPDYDKSQVTPVSPEVSSLENTVYIPSDSFNRIDQYTLTIGPTALKKAGIDTEHFTGTLGADFSYIPGANDLLVSDAGRGLGRNVFSLDGTKPERTITPINDHVKISDYLMLSFLTKSQADNFRGMLFTKDVPMSESLDAFISPEKIGPVDETGALIPLDQEGMKETKAYAASTYPITETSASQKADSSKATSAEKKSEDSLNETLVNSRPAETRSAKSSSQINASEESISKETAPDDSTESSSIEGESNPEDPTHDETVESVETTENTGSDYPTESASSDKSEDAFPTLPGDAKPAETSPSLVNGEHLLAASSPKVR